MRVIHISEALGGGIFEIVNNLSARLADRGHDVAIAYGVRDETPSVLRAAVDPRVELIPTPWTNRTLRASLRASRELRPTVAEWNPDVIHLHSSFAGVIGAATLGGIAPIVYSPQGYSFTMNTSTSKRVVFRALEWLVARRVDVVGASSEAEADLAREILSAPRVKVVPNGIPELDPDRMTPSVPDERRSGAVAMGRVVPQRQPSEVAEILSDLQDIAPVSWLGGGSAPSSELDALAQADIPVTGWLAHEEALKRLGEAKVYLHWTAWDGLALSVLEAMARDVVVIASDIPPNRGVLGPEQVFSSTDDASKAIRRALLDDSYRQSLLREQRERRAHYGSTANATRWEEVYEALAPNPTAGRTVGPSHLVVLC
jgi:glycosyltransferase involved in cell wall biosynthesis